MDGGKGHGKIHQAVNFQMNRREKNILGEIGPLDRKPNDSGSAQAIPARAIGDQLILQKIRALGTLKVMLEVDGQAKTLSIKAIPNLDHDIFLGMDFCREFDIDARLGKRRWRANEDKWRPFVKQGDGVRSTIFAECAGISDISCCRKLGLTTLTEHSIALLDTTPIKHHPRRMSPRMQQIPIEEVERMFDEGIIERSASYYSSAPVMIRKSDGTYRFCVDYRDINRVTRKDAYPIPSMDSILDKLRRARYLTKIDLKQAYYKIPMG